MGVYIKGMEMPKSCWDCPMVSGYEIADEARTRCSTVRCRLTNTKRPVGEAIASDCPLVPVPPHGDLIERDALRASIRESIEECHKWADEVDKDTMMYARISQSLGTFVECSLRAKAAPTIIPAEEGET